MAVFDASQSKSGIDLTTFDLIALTSGKATVFEPTIFRLIDDPDTTTYKEFVGFNFVYGAGNDLMAGIITDITVVDHNVTLFEISGLSLPVADVNDLVVKNDPAGFLAEVFAGNDIMDGSAFADHLLGFAGNDNFDGGAGNDTLTGNAGADTLDGGAGDDTMDGGADADLYFVDSAKDVAADSGVDAAKDTVVTTVTYTIGASIENLTLGGTAAIDGTGNAGNNLLIGNGNFNTLDGGAGADTMQGGAFSDTYIVDNVGDVIVEAKNGGVADLVKSSVTFTLAANIEDLALTGADTIGGTGNELANTLIGNTAANQLNGLAGADSLQGGDGDDTLDGGLGNDTMLGGKGEDLFIVDSIADVVIEVSGEGVNDTVRSSVSYTLNSLGLNTLELVGILNLNGTGNSNDNHIVGNGANNILDGKTGVDTLEGGGGNDTYIVDDSKELVIEAAAAGYDIVKSSASFNLLTNGPNVEELQLTGTAAIDGTGDGLANKLTGNTAANKLDGGAGDDTMIGGAGDDIYVVDSAKDVITDSSGANDEVYITGKDAALVKLYTNVEHYNLSLLDLGAGVNFTGTTAANRITGTTLDDTLVGGTGNDTLLGGDGKDSLNGGVGNDLLDGGTGDDTMDGGAGNDTYVIDTLTDNIIETGKDTGDTVQTAGSLVITHIDLTDPFFAGIENVKFTGTADLNAVGTAGNNVLTGNDGANLLVGGDGNDTLVGGAGNDTLFGDDSLGGGKGADSMAGGDGDDDYYVDSIGDKIFEGENGGFDTVRSTISYVLGANLNTLVLLGAANLNGNGNELFNELRGTEGKNILDGKGGDDTLQGFGGDDTYIVDSKNDLIVEGVDGGHDTVKSTATYSLAINGINVEDLVLTGGANIDGTGNDDANFIAGNAASNKLDGGLGADTMQGGAGDDIYTVDNLKDLVTEQGGSGLHDTVVFQIIDASLEKLISGIENYDFSKYTIPVIFAGDGADNAITGGVNNDALTGNAGNDTLDGGTGVDTLTGGVGNDTYVINTLADQVVELKGAGTDTVVSMLPDYVLSEPTPTFNIENLTLGDTDDANGTGNSQANLIRGNAFDNALNGLAGNDTIFASNGDDTLDGGTGNDSLVGGFGSDTYILDSKSDRVLEADGLGVHDKIIAPFDYTLGAFIEDLTLTGTAKNGTGNDLANHIIGNDLDNVLDGKGGIDVLEGGKGDDTYIIRSIAETVTEQTNEGNDTVKTSWKEFHMPDNVENLIFTVGWHNSNTGNASNNHIVGNVVSDTLQGGAGNDTLDGGAGGDSLVGGTDNDTYIIDNALDVVQEFGGGGIDTFQAKISIDLAHYQAVGNLDVIENVTLTGAGALSATGNGLGNILTGNTGANILDGKDGADTLDGGVGNDVLIGGKGDDHIDVSLGNDVVRYTSALDGHDVLSGFDGNATGGQDTLNLDALFDGLSIAAADRAIRVSFVPAIGSVDVQVDISAAHDHSSVLTVATLNLANPADAITVGQDVIVGT